ncbi:MAG: hypothetical protein ACKOOL_02330 [Novosphingobium sp.]
MHFRHLILSAPFLLMIAGCASERGEYPSLARRPAERITADFDTPAAPVEVVRPAPPVSVTGKLGSLVSAAQAADAKFSSREPRARTAVSAGAGAKIGSESWATATIAVAELEAARAEAMLALADLDTLFNDTSVNGEDARGIGTERDKVIGLIARQDRVLAELRSQLGS